MVVVPIGDEDELAAKGNALDTATGMDGVCFQYQVAGARDEDTRPIDVERATSSCIEAKMSLRAAIGLSDQNVGISDLWRIQEYRRRDEKDPDDLILEDVDLVVDVHTRVDFEENEEKIPSRGMISQAYGRRKRDPDRMKTVTHIVELICQGAVIRPVVGNEEAIGELEPESADVVAAGREGSHLQSNFPIVNVRVICCGTMSVAVEEDVSV